jgi:hydrogenase small subunit
MGDRDKTDDPLAPAARRRCPLPATEAPLRLGSLEKAYVIWLAGGSCDGCSVAVTGATQPRLEQLLTGTIPGVPRIELLHTDFSIESGPEWTENLFMAERGELDAPYIVTYEGSVPDESRAGDGFWAAVGYDPVSGRQLTSREWLERLAPGAAAVIAIGTCASFGGVPAAHGNATGATGVPSCLGDGYRSAAGLPLVILPGCAPPGDTYVEVAAAVLLFLNGLAPLPEFDEMGRPAWMYGSTVHAHCTRTRSYLAGVFAREYGDAECLVELGCQGPTSVCTVAERGVIDGHGGCMSVGGICIGCTMPGFPDVYLPAARHLPAHPTVVRRPGSFRRRMAAVRARAGTGPLALCRVTVATRLPRDKEPVVA